MSKEPIMSVSGIRGIVGETITEELCAAIAYLQTKACGGGTMVVSRDTRPSGQRFAEAVIQGIHAAGGKALDIGIAPTPTACVAVEYFKASGGVILTASHNPAPYNGYKMVHQSGRLFTGNECEEIYAAYRSRSYPEVSSLSQQSSRPDQITDASVPHVERILEVVDAQRIRSAGLSIAVDMINGAAAAVVPQLLKKLSVNCHSINSSLSGDFTHNPEPRPDHLGELTEVLKGGNFDAGFAFDPDADRLITMGEKGQAISEEMTLVLGLQNILSKKPANVATNLSTSMIIDDVAKKFGVKVFRTKIGEANVIEGMTRFGCEVGGEGNGGVIYPRISTVRDGLASLALILELLATLKAPLTSIVSSWPTYAMIKDKIPLTDKDPRAIIETLSRNLVGETIDLQDGLKVIRPNGWVHLRASNTEPILRCYAEASTEEEARSLLAMISARL